MNNLHFVIFSAIPRIENIRFRKQSIETNNNII